MSGLPRLVQRAPAFFYGAAILFFVASVLLNHLEVAATMEFVNGSNSVVQLSRLRALYQGSLEALYLAANGVIIQVLLAIWRGGGLESHSGGEA